MTYSRRTFCKMGLAFGASMMIPAAGLLSGKNTAWAAQFPDKNFTIYIPSKPGGQLERIARAHSDVWSKDFGVGCAFKFNEAASGEVAYTMFAQSEPDGYNLLFGNTEPFVVMYVNQAPKFNENDLFWACTLAVDPAVIITNKESKFKTIEDVLKSKDTINIAVAHWASMDTLAVLKLAEKSGVKFNIVPYAGGKKANLGIVQNEVDLYFTKLGNAEEISSYSRYLCIVQDENEFPVLTENCPTLAKSLGQDFPEIQSLRNWVMLRSFVEKYPENYKLLMDMFKKTYDSEEFKATAEKQGVPRKLLTHFRDAEWTQKRYAQSLQFAEENKAILKKR